MAKKKEYTLGVNSVGKYENLSNTYFSQLLQQMVDPFPANNIKQLLYSRAKTQFHNKCKAHHNAKFFWYIYCSLRNDVHVNVKKILYTNH